MKRPDIKAGELLDAWEILSKYKGIVHNWWRFIEGTIDKIRNQEKNKHALKNKKGRQPCKKIKTQEICKEESSEKDTLEPRYQKSPISLGEALKKLQNG
jgi:hypothetical protein